MDPALATLERDPGASQLRPEPAEVRALDRRAVREGGCAVAVGPFDANLRPEALQHSTDEAVVAGARLGRFGDDRDPARAFGRDDQWGSGRMKVDRERSRA